jgi:hypothetical protein
MGEFKEESCKGRILDRREGTSSGWGVFTVSVAPLSVRFRRQVSDPFGREITIQDPF